MISKYSYWQMLIIVAFAGLLAAFSKYVEIAYNINFFVVYFVVLVIGLSVKKILEKYNKQGWYSNPAYSC